MISTPCALQASLQIFGRDMRTCVVAEQQPSRTLVPNFKSKKRGGASLFAFMVRVFITDIKNVSALMDTHTGRGDKIRTCGLYVPNVALYQTEPHLDGVYLIVFMDQPLKSGISGERIRPKQSVFSRRLHSIAQKEEFVNLFFCFL